MAKKHPSTPKAAAEPRRTSAAPVAANVGTVELRPIESEMRESYLDYAMSVIVGRALPDVRDGMKPVHRRILYAMWEMGLRAGTKFRKSAAIVGTTLARFHPHGDVAVYDAMVRLAQDFNMRYRLVDGQGNFGCFTGDTKIKLLDGTIRSFEQLAKDFSPHQKFAVYSVDSDGNIVVGWAQNPRITRRKVQVIELTLNNGSKIRCTPDHRFLLRNGSYKAAQELAQKDSILSGYFRTRPIKEELNDYLQVLQPRNRRWEFVHVLADRENQRRGLAAKFRGPFVRHHTNFNRFDNRPENIQRLTFLDHLKIHQKHMKELWNDPEFRSKQAAGIKKFYELHPEAREQQRQRTLKRNQSKEFQVRSAQKRSAIMKRKHAANPKLAQAISERMVELWKDPAFKQKMSIVLRGSHTTPLAPEMMARVKQIISTKSKLMWQSKKQEEIVAAIRIALQDPKIKLKKSIKAKQLWQKPEYRDQFPADHFSKMAKKLWEKPEIIEYHRTKAKKQWQDPSFRQKFIAGVQARNRKRIADDPWLMKRLAQKSAKTLKQRWQSPAHRKQVIRSRILFFGAYLLSQFQREQITPTLYEAERYNNAFPRYPKMLEYFPSLNAMLDEAATYNHRVVSKRVLTERFDVWDITVDQYHNFLLADGVFVHNSMDGDNPAAQRYTEARLTKLAEELLNNIDKDTVDFIPNYDGAVQEPRVLPAKIPQLLLNGTVGIAVGMATNVPPHNLSELCDGLMHLIDHPNCDVEDLMEFVHGPDFPTGGQIFNINDIRTTYATGRGPIVMRGRAEIVEDKSGLFRIVITEIPYQVNKATLVTKIADLVRDKKLDGIKDLRDESDREGVRVVIDLKKDSYPRKVLNRLYQLTQLQETFHVNMLALVDGLQPRVLTLKMVLEEFLKHREVVITRRTKFELGKAEERAHILEGLVMALEKIDAIISTIKKSRDREEAKVNLIKKFRLSERQSIAILEMKLQQLANLERLKVEEELKEKRKLIKELKSILSNRKNILAVAKKELTELKEKFGDERRTEVVKGGIGKFTQEDLIPKEAAVVMLTRDGYIKRLSPDTFQTQRRGGKGVIGLTTKEADTVEHLFTTNTHVDLLFFTSRGRVFQLKTYEIPSASRTAKGQAIVNFLQLAPEEKVSEILAVDDLKPFKYLMMVTQQGTIKKTELTMFENIRRSGLIALKLHDGDRLIWVKPTTGKDDVILVSDNGQSIRFQEGNVRGMGRTAAGVRGIRLKKGGFVAGMDIIAEGKTVAEEQLLVIMSNGYGKRTPVKAYRVQGRGGSGVKTAKITTKTGSIVSAFIVNKKREQEDLIVMSVKGQVIRLPLKQISVLGRDTQGVRIMKFKESGDQVASVTFV